MSYEKSLIDSKQDELVSGTNIKTINGVSILGSGDLVVTGGGGITAVAVVGANGITGASVNTLGVANLTLALGAITPTSVNSVVVSGTSTPTLAVTGTTSVSGTNTGDQTSIVGITGTKAEFDTAVTDGNIVYVGDAIAATTITQDASNRLVTDTEKTTWNGKQDAITNGYGLSGTTTKAVGLTSTQAFCTGETTISATTYADITGASITLDAGTWLIMATINGASQTTTVAVMIGAITTDTNTVISEGAQHIVAGTATVRTWGNLSLSAVVSPVVSTTYKLRGAKGQTTQTGNWIASDGTGRGTANNVSNNSDKSTVIMAVRIA
jgi:hypothetical protein